MDLFVLNEQLAEIQRAVELAEGSEASMRLPLIVELAWHLRQRDCAGALRWAEVADGLLEAASTPAAGGLDGPALQQIQARLLLVRAEVDFMYIRHQAAEQAIDQARAGFAACQDAAGLGDCQMLMASVWIDRGDNARRDQAMNAAIDHYLQAGDKARQDCANARRLFMMAFSDAKLAADGVAACFPADGEICEAAEAWLSSARAVLNAYTVEFAESIRYFSLAYSLAMDSGQIRLAIIVSGNCAESFATLGDLDSSLEWNERSIDMARRNAWPISLGFSLTQTANTLRLLGRHAEAMEMLTEALDVMKSQTSFNGYVMAIGYAGEVSLDLGEVDKALDYLRQFENAAMATYGAPVALLRCLHTQARALGLKKEPQAAFAKAQEALELAKAYGIFDEQIKVLRVLATLYRDFPQTFEAPPDMSEATPVLHLLKQALTMAKGIQGYTAPSELFDELANACADVGDFQSAFQFGKTASSARATQRMLDARNRAIGLALREETIRAQAQIAHHQHVAQAEAKRAELLHETSVTLEALGQIGREITATLNREAIFESLFRHAKDLLDVTSFYVYLLADDGQTLSGEFAVDAGKRIELDAVPMDSPIAYSARCARGREEIVVDLTQNTAVVEVVPGTEATLSLLLSPLKIGERLLGVISIQSVRAHAYGERERSISRTLCAYAAIAVDNSKAYAAVEQAQRQTQQALQALRQTQSQLVQAEKLAALGGLIAGVAHELNTPLGNGLVAVSSLSDRLQAFQASVASGGLKRQAFDQFLRDVEDTTQLTLSSLQRSARLVSSFKQLAVDPKDWPRAPCVLSEVIDAALMSRRARMAEAQIEVLVTVDAGLRIQTCPSALTTVLECLIDNALQHGLAGRERGGRIALRCSLDGGEAGAALNLGVADNGCGIAPEHLAKVFDPFFTTRMGQSSGLGLYSVNNLVTQVLGGRLSVQSALGEGTEFQLHLPPEALV